MTVERGLAENILLRSMNLYKRYFQTGSISVNSWYNAKDASWCINVYRISGGQHESLADMGKGWDFVQAAEEYRKNFLVYFGEQFAQDGQPFAFQNFAEVEDKIDSLHSVSRNEVGAVEGEDVVSEDSPLTPQHLSGLVEHLSSLNKTLQTIIKQHHAESAD